MNFLVEQGQEMSVTWNMSPEAILQAGFSLSFSIPGAIQPNRDCPIKLAPVDKK